jgi:hypothetical protein
MTPLIRALAADKRRRPPKGPGLGLPPSMNKGLWRMLDLNQQITAEHGNWRGQGGTLPYGW